MSNPESAKFIAQHTVAADETLSHIALKYYGSAVREKWMLIYEANKETIGENPNLIHPGMMLNIPAQDASRTPSTDEFHTSGHNTTPPRTEKQNKFD
jgi:nucleoid-associated protein YgaU